MGKVLLIVNPVAGGKDKTEIVRLAGEILGACDVVYTTHAGHETELAREAEAETVVAVGGDGTVSEVASGLVGSGKALGIVPCGSGDGLALHLGLSRNPRKVLETIRRGVTEVIDCGEVNSRPFFVTTGVGFDAKVGYDFASAGTRGFLTYIKVSIRDWFSYKEDEYELTVDGRSWRGKALMITVGNANQWGNNARICGPASLRDGKFFVTVVKPVGSLRLISMLPALFTGKVTKCRSAVCLEGSRVEIRRSADAPMHVDGESMIGGREISAVVRPAALKVIIGKMKEEI